MRERSVTLFLIILVTIAGIYAFLASGERRIPFTVKQMTVITVWPGATAQEMQDQVAEPLEKRLQELKWYDRTETYTRPGMAFITLSLGTIRRHHRCRKSSTVRGRSLAMKAETSPPA